MGKDNRMNKTRPNGSFAESKVGFSIADLIRFLTADPKLADTKAQIFVNDERMACAEFHPANDLDPAQIYLLGDKHVR